MIKIPSNHDNNINHNHNNNNSISFDKKDEHDFPINRLAINNNNNQPAFATVQSIIFLNTVNHLLALKVYQQKKLLIMSIHSK